MTEDETNQAARNLFEAEISGVQTGLISKAYPDVTMDDAYRIQEALVDLKRKSGLGIIGWKIGLTSKAMQAALGIDIPDSGVLLDNMLFQNGAVIPKARFIEPRIEAEIAFVMKDDLEGGKTTVEDVLSATDYVVPSLEVLDTRILRKDPKSGVTRGICDTISDNAANAGIVLGDQKLDPRKTDMCRMGAVLSRNGDVEETGLGAGVLGNPPLAIAWLADRLALYDQKIKAGEVLLSGSFIRPVEAPSGSLIEADFGEFGTVSVKFD